MKPQKHWRVSFYTMPLPVQLSPLSVHQACMPQSEFSIHLIAHLTQKMTTPTEEIYLFEYDARFERLAPNPTKFVNYDYNSPMKFPSPLLGKVDRVLADPPFLSDECLTRTAMTVRTLLRKGGKVMVCTGRKMEDLVPKLFLGTKKVEFEPKHKGGLANAFGCYMNWKGEYI
jgi:Probable N6-adenine methyltransferase